MGLYECIGGGIRLQVPEEATEILGLKIDEDAAMIICPECGSKDLVFLQMSRWVALLYFFAGFIFPMKTKRATWTKCKAVFDYSDAIKKS